ncbi:MAG: FumA C-terminus/TtdB family hydratase beta subunit [Desulfurococcaceae archaeon]|jgi:fumarate hydratase subunit beta|nr:FumA C-terminus/TtdB family hydratase beta subunit [Desulfurococcaceae archaeon]
MVEYRLRTPISEEDVRKLRVGDILYVTGVIYTARDAAHRRIIDYLKEGKPLPFDLRGGVVYHCGPVVAKRDGQWVVIAGGPTTSARMELYEYEVIEKLGVRIVIGKGGMGRRTAEACAKYGAVYATYTGGAAVLAAQSIKRVVDVHWLDLGIPEAVWVLEVEDFGPLVVAIDSTGRNLIEEVLERSVKKKEELLKRPL